MYVTIQLPFIEEHGTDEVGCGLVEQIIKREILVTLAFNGLDQHSSLILNIVLDRLLSEAEILQRMKRQASQLAPRLPVAFDHACNHGYDL